MSYHHATAGVPSSIALPTDPNDQSPDYDVTVVFDWKAGTAPSGLSGPPENYDPGEGDEFVVQSSGDIAGPDLPPEVDAAIVDWLNENWERPDYGPDPDDLRDRMRDDELTERVVMESDQ